ncbi:putative actin family protein [Lyophyllum shimeji]|uniref:Actin family protein n=1 Tax=Lyophyllum shimeji TaxID=47721 RepID=A0A9P3PUY2_LYOSH|nr:putative actin family protein [Lyophyllum shimeji]
MSFRDLNVVIIETGRTYVRAGLGLHDLLKTPSVEILARVGLRKNASGEHLNKSQQPIPPHANGIKKAISSSSRVSSLPQHYEPNASVNDYLVGSALDEALAAGQEVSISWPFADGDVRDWTQAEAIWKYVLFNQLQRRRVQNESPVLLSIFPGLARDTYERICQTFFERFNAAGLAIIERPIAQLYAGNSLNGVVVDIDEEKTDITPISDGFILHQARSTIPLGTRDCQNYLAHLLKSNQAVVAALSPPESPLDPQTLHSTLVDLVKQLCTEGHVKVPGHGETAAVEDEGITDIAAIVVAGKEKAVIESGMKKKLTAKASAAEQARAREIEALDLITVQFREHSLTLGKERHRLCEPLFDPTLLECVPGIAPVTNAQRSLPLQEAVGIVVGQTDVDQRQSLWSGLLVTGDLTRYVKGIGTALQSRVAPYIVNPDLQSEVQPRYARTLTVPEYYAEYRDTGNGLACFLGSSITAKIIFNDNGAKNFVSKADYAVKGPHSIIEMTPTLL